MFLALREMRFAKTRYALIVIIMLLVSFLVMFVTGLARGLAYANASSIENMPADYFIVQKDAGQRFGRSVVTPDTLSQAVSVVGQKNAQPLGVQMTTVTQGGEGTKTDVTLFAADPEGWIMPEVIEGSRRTGSDEVLADSKLKESGFRLGSQIHDQMTGAEWTVAGFVKNESYSHTPVVYMDMQQWDSWKAKFAAKPGTAKEETTYNTIAVKADNGQADKLASKLGDMQILSKKSAIAAIPGYKEEQGSLLMMITFLFVISGFVLAVFFYVITIQKTSQFGILKAMGTSSGYLARSVLAQVLMLTISSLAVSLLLVAAANRLLPDSMPFKLDAGSIVLTSVLFVVMAVAGSLISVVKVAKVDALDAIGRVSA
ncbi:ABC transporter permease [Paenibacillus sp. J22TS3]|uniref:ABC transporter permease n=1 Tax=Paenibacillus sp. J22TS3 TaxID=2807192 RepID=UPI001B1B365A|nr:ABC transporter permease [Paenibacillus sp. J22TS3]GIP19992.1 ABC transporter permease [Paenibacillus sp. J22TS3]